MLHYLFDGLLHRKRFKIWRYYYDKHDRSFAKDGQNHRIISSVNSNFVAIGDQRENFKRELRNLLREKYGDDVENQEGIFLDMEPFEALCRMLQKTDRKNTIGGAPQMIKSYQYMNCRPVGVYWPEKKNVFSNRTILGRRLFDYEDTKYWFIDPVTLRTNPCNKSEDHNELKSM